MRTALKWIGRIGLGLVVLLAVGLGGGYVYVRTGLPDYEGQLTLEGLSAPVTITRDANAMPHIEAQSDLDAYFAVGFVHAQDRMWQLEVNRRAIEGRLSEMFGAATLETDQFLRGLGIFESAKKSLEKLDAETRAALEAYARGVNAGIKSHKGALPPEFLVLGVKPGEWTPAHSVGWVKMMALDLGDNYRLELVRLRLSQNLSPKLMAEFIPPYPGEDMAVLPDLRELYARFAGRFDWDKFARMMADKPEGMGSNNWVVSGAHTESGKPMLANDPHLGLSVPAIWYYVHIKSPNMQVIGASMPGTPSVTLGRNQRIAWGFTNTAPDVQDFFIEKIAENDPNSYITPEGPRPFETRQEVFNIKGAEPVTMTLRRTRHGPVMSDVIKSAKEATPEGYVLALSWTALAEDDTTIQSMFKIARAQNWQEFIESTRSFQAPQQNIVYADVDGNIGYVAPGKIPVRRADNDIKGRAPSPGWDARYDWAGYIPFEELPRAFNPPSGKIVTANHKITPPGYPHYLTSEWSEPERANRIQELLDATPKHNHETFRTILGDVKSGRAVKMTPHILAAAPQTDAAKRAQETFKNWDFVMGVDAPQALILSAWFRRMPGLLSNDETDGLGDVTAYFRMTFVDRVLSNADGMGHWCDNVKTPAAESCAQIAGQALDEAIEELTQTYGSDMAKWNWGEAHQAVSSHRPFSQVAVLRDIFELRAPTPGDSHTVNVGSMRHASEPYANTHAASLRAIYDLANLDQSQYMYSTGQSGHALSDFYGNMKQEWAAVRMLPLDTRPETYQKGALGRLELKPQP